VPPPPPEPPRAVDEAVQRARSDERRRATQATGYGSTLLSSGLGAAPAMTAGKTLLGQ
jgi:hypothetical protein